MVSAPPPDDPGAGPAERQMRFLFALRSHGVTDPRVLAAMERIDRGAFVRGHFEDRAYEDTPLPIACGQTISQPSVVGLMTQALNVGPRDVVLEVGTGSGYQAAVLSLLCRRVMTVDRHRRLVVEAEALFRHPGQVLSRTQLLDQVWGYDYDPGSNVVEVYVGYLRKKLDVPFSLHTLQTVRGLGYRLEADV